MFGYHERCLPSGIEATHWTVKLHMFGDSIEISPLSNVKIAGCNYSDLG